MFMEFVIHADSLESSREVAPCKVIEKVHEFVLEFLRKVGNKIKNALNEFSF